PPRDPPPRTRAAQSRAAARRAGATTPPPPRAPPRTGPARPGSSGDPARAHRSLRGRRCSAEPAALPRASPAGRIRPQSGPPDPPPAPLLPAQIGRWDRSQAPPDSPPAPRGTAPPQAPAQLERSAPRRAYEAPAQEPKRLAKERSPLPAPCHLGPA